MAPVPPSILRALSLPNLNPSKATLSTSGLGSGFSNTGRIQIFLPSKTSSKQTEEAEDEEERQYFLKTSSDGKEMFQGEFASLNAIADAVPGFCPRALGWGALDEKKSYFLVTEYLDLSGRSRSAGTESKTSFAQRLGRLHNTPAPSSPSSSKPKYGFPVPTYCGNTRQPNNFHDSWAEFYANERLLMVLKEAERKNGSDAGLRDLVTKTAEKVVPRLLADDHLGYDQNGQGEGIYPVVVHGDLWSGNASQGRIVKCSADEDDEGGEGGVVYDPSACYAHNEYELGIMHMFGGFGKAFFDEYHSIVPRTEPVEEYDDRVKLYELYHHLNHHAIFGGGYKSGAISIMNKLVSKYGGG